MRGGGWPQARVEVRPSAGRPRAARADGGPLHRSNGKDPTGALELLEETESGQLYRCSPSFFDALEEADQTLARLARDEPELFHARREELAHKWLQMGGWHPEMVSTQNRLFRIGTVRQAAAKGQSLYCWYGPPVAEYVVASGGSEELDAYLSTKRRPRG